MLKEGFKYGLLRTDSSPEADSHNASLLGEKTLGIEVTDRNLASRCGLGNIDPQHGAEIQPDSSAIHASLTHQVPPDGAILVTIRPDADAFGAMAVLTLRALFLDNLIRLPLIDMIHSIDNLGFPRALKEDPKVTQYKLEREAIWQIVLNRNDRWPTIYSRVIGLARIFADFMPQSDVAEIASLAALNNKNDFDVSVVAPDLVVLVNAPRRYNAARSFGQARFPVTIIRDDEYVMPGSAGYKPHRRWCVARRSDGDCDIERLKSNLNRAEAQARSCTVPELEKQGFAWVGSRNLACSPYNVVSALKEKDIIDCVVNCLK